MTGTSYAKCTFTCRLAVQRRFCGRIKEQMDAFNRGFDEIIPRQCLKVFDENELEVSGTQLSSSYIYYNIMYTCTLSSHQSINQSISSNLWNLFRW